VTSVQASAPQPVLLAPAQHAPVIVAQKSGKMAPVLQALEAAVKLDGFGRASEVMKDPLIDGLEAYAVVLECISGKLGASFVSNSKKLRSSKASPSEKSYRPWLLSELHVHKANGYKGYVDDSAWMGNLWIGWTLEFFVEMFALLKDGSETKPSVDAAYSKTLYNHHGFVQRTAFQAAVKNLPTQRGIIQKLSGDASESDVLRELDMFVKFGRPLAKFCIDVNQELDNRMKEEQKVYSGRR